jgi:UDP:flavonoid glycosyltransferase YjiC (YdhE family)
MDAARFLLTPIGSAGDVYPFVGIGRALRARGHEVIVITAEPFGEVVHRAGLGFHQTISTEEYDRMSRHPDLWNRWGGLQLMLKEVGARLRVGYECLMSLYAPGRTVLVGHSLSFFTRVFEELHDAPAATVHLAPSVLRSDYEQPAYAPGRDVSGWPRLLKRGLWWGIDRFMIDPCVAPALNQWRSELGLARVDRFFGEWINSPRRVIGLFPDWFGPPQPDWPQSLRLTGFPLYDPVGGGIAPDLRRFLDQGPPPLLFTPGSANQAATRFFRAGIDASEQLGQRAVFLTRHASQLPKLPSSIHHAPFVPLAAILPSCAALVHHAGVGTLAQGLSAGIPQLTMPMGFDQPDNATRLQRLGVGRWLTARRFEGARVAEILQEILSDAEIVAQCRKWSSRMAARDALQETCDLLEELIP